MLSASKHADVLSKEEYDVDLSKPTRHLALPAISPSHPSHSLPVPPTPHTQPQPPTQKREREPTAYNLFVSSLPAKTPNRFVYASQAWKELPPAEKERMRAFLVQYTHELRDIHPDVRQRFRAITKLWLMSKN